MLLNYGAEQGLSRTFPGVEKEEEEKGERVGNELRREPREGLTMGFTGELHQHAKVG